MKAILCTVTLALALSGCSFKKEDAPESKQENMVSIIRDKYPLEDVSDREIVKTGEEICDAFDGGASYEDVFNELHVDSPEKAKFYGFFIGVSVDQLCPEHVDKFAQT